jgi:hypothetical protein
MRDTLNKPKVKALVAKCESERADRLKNWTYTWGFYHSDCSQFWWRG